MAHPPAVPDQPVAEHRPVASREQRGHRGLDLVRVGLRGPAESAGEPAEVRVDGDAGDAEGVAEHDVGGLAPDARQRDQVLEPAGHLTVVALDQRLAQPDQRVGLGPEEPGGLDHRLELGAVGGGVVGGGAVRREQRRRDHVDPGVGALGGQDGRDQQLERRGEVQLAVGVGVGLGEDPVDPPGAPGQRERRLAGDVEGRHGPVSPAHPAEPTVRRRRSFKRRSSASTVRVTCGQGPRGTPTITRGDRQPAAGPRDGT